MTVRFFAFTADLLDRRVLGVCHRCGWRSMVTKVRSQGYGFLCDECAGIVRALTKVAK